MTVPIEVVAQYPQFTGLDREPPGYVATKPLAIDRIKSTEPKQEFARSAEARMMGGGSKNREASIANMMLSNSTSVVQGLLEYQTHRKLVNDKRMEAYLTSMSGPVYPLIVSSTNRTSSVSILFLLEPYVHVFNIRNWAWYIKSSRCTLYGVLV